MKNNDIKYYVVKDNKNKTITYFEYDKMKGYDITPKSNVKIKDAINVNKMVIINPTMINKMVIKKLNNKFEKLLKIITLIYEEDSDDDVGYRHALNELEKLRMEMINKYKEHITKEEEELFLKKLEILETELKLRIQIIDRKVYEQENIMTSGKSR
ncbi:MAG: hypothetical protein PHQ64_03870 [Bacilli bacterium]|nr:hypothetical protein [Bacilli bacterium]